MSRPLNSKKSWYKVYIKELNTPNIMKNEWGEYQNEQTFKQ
nr:MAG TPA: hypothetical protein [Bacteriophage sp.]